MLLCYDELGRLVAKTYGAGTAGAFTETFDYNVRGWLTGQSSPHFEMALRYNDPLRPEIAASWTGNITEWDWKHKGTGADNTLNTYGFNYDRLNRLVDTKRYLAGSPIQTNSFTEKDITYDKMGNILTLKRYGAAAGTAEDDFAYTYNGNKLMLLNNGPDTYAYDSNGNCTFDALNALILEYNALNLVSRVKDPSDNSTIATYKWLADGRKASAVNGDNTFGLEYLGSLVYKKSGGTLELESAAFGGGRINKASNAYEVNYFLTDHLGSTRAVFNAASSEVAERNNYHSFGQRWDTGGSAISTNRYRFSGKEEQDVFGFDYLDFGARMKNDIRWGSIDPLAELDYPTSPYVYCRNNPIRSIDPDGRSSFTLYGAAAQAAVATLQKLYPHWGEKNEEDEGYTVDRAGNVEQVDNTGGDDFDVLIEKEAYDRGVRSGPKFAPGILSQLAVSQGKRDGSTAIGYIRQALGSVFSAYDMAKLYLVVTNATDVEWSLSLGRKNGVLKLGLMTWGDRQHVGFPFTFGDLFIGIHSHQAKEMIPGVSEEDSMYGDKKNSIKWPYIRYTYFPGSGNLYRTKDGKIYLLPDRGTPSLIQSLIWKK